MIFPNAISNSKCKLAGMFKIISEMDKITIQDVFRRNNNYIPTLFGFNSCFRCWPFPSILYYLVSIKKWEIEETGL